jgi:hypothetical protein
VYHIGLIHQSLQETTGREDGDWPGPYAATEGPIMKSYLAVPLFPSEHAGVTSHDSNRHADYLGPTCD